MPQSRLHNMIEKLIATATNPNVRIMAPDGTVASLKGDPERIVGLALVAAISPHYLMDKDLVHLLSTGAVETQLRALGAVGGIHLPHECMVLEVPDVDVGTTAFFMLTEMPEEHRAVYGHFNVMFFSLTPRGTGIPFGIALTEANDFTKWKCAALLDFEPPSHLEDWVGRAVKVLDTAILFPHVKGLARAVEPAPEKLNKQRAAKGKPRIQEFTTIYIGRVEDANGKSHAYTGRTMPVHMRAGHTRNQRYGKGRELVKTVYIAPVLVNFKQGDEVPVPRRVVKMVA
jgi:hypothetical protein